MNRLVLFAILCSIMLLVDDVAGWGRRRRRRRRRRSGRRRRGRWRKVGRFALKAAPHVIKWGLKIFGDKSIDELTDEEFEAIQQNEDFQKIVQDLYENEAPDFDNMENEVWKN